MPCAAAFYGKRPAFRDISCPDNRRTQEGLWQLTQGEPDVHCKDRRFYITDNKKPEAPVRGQQVALTSLPHSSIPDILIRSSSSVAKHWVWVHIIRNIQTVLRIRMCCWPTCPSSESRLVFRARRDLPRALARRQIDIGSAAEFHGWRAAAEPAATKIKAIPGDRRPSPLTLCSCFTQHFCMGSLLNSSCSLPVVIAWLPVFSAPKSEL